MSSITARTFTQVFNDARAIGLLNDSSSARYPDSVLLPHAADVLFELQDEFAARDIPFVETVVDTPTYTALADTITIPAGITDLDEPLELWEKDETGTLWAQMERVSRLRPPLVANLDRLYWWEWQSGAVRVLPCTTNRDIFMRYRRHLAYPTAASPVNFDGIYFALVNGTAYKAATSRPDVQAKAQAEYFRALERAIRKASRGGQSVSYRRRAWNGRGSARPVPYIIAS